MENKSGMGWKEKCRGLSALWIALAMLLSSPPLTAMADRPNDDVYLYKGSGSISAGDYVDNSETELTSVGFDISFDEQNALTDGIIVPEGYDLDKWQLWGYNASGFVEGEPFDVAKNGSLSESEYDSLAAGKSLLAVPLFVCKPPSVSISIEDGGYSWQSFSCGVSFSVFYKEAQSIYVTADDEGSGIRDVSYCLSDTDLFPESRDYSDAEIEERIGWSAYSEDIVLADEGRYILYVKAVDNEGNAAYAGTEGIVIDQTPPVISVENSGTVYYGDIVTFSVSEDYPDVVTVDGNVVTADNGIYAFTAEQESHTIAAADKAGNSESVVVRAEAVPEENRDISSGGIFSLTAGVPYYLGSGTWKVAGDDTVYEGGVTFYVGESGSFEFQKQ